MADPEIIVEVKIPEGEGATPPEPVAPVVVVPVVDSATGGDMLGAALAVMSLESLAEENAALRSRVDSLESFRENVHERIDSIESRQFMAEIEEVEEGEIVTETIPEPVAEIIAEVQPMARKRRFIE